jgi:hypothetical protein
VEWNNQNISFYLNGNWENIIKANIAKTRKQKEYKDILRFMWYEEVMNWKMYIIQKEGNAIDKYSLDYFNLWSKLSFNISYNFNNKSESQEISQTQFDKLYPIYLSNWSFRIQNLQEYLKRWQIDKQYFKSKLPELEKLLPSQCLDTRFEKIFISWWKQTSDLIKEDEVKWYYKEWLISKDTAIQCYKNIQERDKKIEEYNKEKSKIHKDSKNEVENYFG